MGLGEGTLMLSDIRRLGPFLGVQILNFRGEGVQKEDFFRGGGGGLGYDDTVGIWGGGGHRKTGLFFGVISKFKV